MSRAGSVTPDSLPCVTSHRIASTMPTITMPQKTSITNIIPMPHIPHIGCMPHPHSYGRSCAAAREGHRQRSMPRTIFAGSGRPRTGARCPCASNGGVERVARTSTAHRMTRPPLGPFSSKKVTFALLFTVAFRRGKSSSAHKHRDLAVRKHLGGLAAQDQRGHSLAAMGGHEDQVTLVLPGRFDDGCVGVIMNDVQCTEGHSGGLSHRFRDPQGLRSKCLALPLILLRRVDDHPGIAEAVAKAA